jgi:hypothetical protein
MAFAEKAMPRHRTPMLRETNFMFLTSFARGLLRMPARSLAKKIAFVTKIWSKENRGNVRAGREPPSQQRPARTKTNL